MAKAKKSATKKTKIPPKPVSAPRRLKPPKYKTFRVSKRLKNTQPKLPNAFKLFISSLITLKKHWKLFAGISLIYGLLALILVRGLSSGTNIQQTKDALQATFGGQFGGLATSAVLFSYLIGSGNATSTPDGGVYQTVLIIMISLAIIWALRQVLAGNMVKIRDTFYRGLYPIVPFILVLMVIGLQLIPLLVGSWVYGTVIANGIAISALEKVMWGIFFLLLALLSLYMICSSLFALYIVTLPDMTPMKALRSARQLVLYRRWLILRKVLFLPLALLVIGAVIFMPLVIFLAGAVEWIFFALSVYILAVIHSYMYTLYRAML